MFTMGTTKLPLIHGTYVIKYSSVKSVFVFLFFGPRYCDEHNERGVWYFERSLYVAVFQARSSKIQPCCRAARCI